MTEAEQIRRILVALDASPHSLSALEAAVELAADLSAELVGVFVEDVNLVRMAGLPVTREVGHTSARLREIDLRRIERDLHGQALRAEKALATAARRRQVRWSFRVSRGSIGAQLVEAASQVDLVVMGRTGWSSRRRSGSSVEAVLASGLRRTLVVEEGLRLQPTLLVIHDGSAMADRALDSAISLARSTGGYLAVGILARDAELARLRQSEIAARLRPLGLEVRYRWLLDVGIQTLAEMIRTPERCVLVLPAESPLLHGRPLGETLEKLSCPVLIVR
ncbi:MAG: universal stress protein [Chloroflexota bacterium]